MNAGYKELCKAQNIDLIDTTDWDIPMAFDGVHIAEDSQKAFADKMIKSLTDILNNEK